MSKILCIIDGMSDSCFSAEQYPMLASFPKRSYVKTVAKGFEAETLPCVLSLLGIKPPHHIRGWVEALGAEAVVSPSDLIFRGSWVSLGENGICTGFCDAPQNIPKLEQAHYISLGGYKCLLIFPNCASYISSISEILPFELLGKPVPNSIYTDIPLLQLTFKGINRIGSNSIMIPWAASVAQAMPNLSQCAAVCGTNVVKGIAKALNMRLITTEEMTGDTDTNLKVKLFYTLELAEKYPFVLLHIGGCDEASHRMNSIEKKLFLSEIDKIVLSELLQSNHSIEVVSDHGADPVTGRHTAEEQPLFSRPR